MSENKKNVDSFLRVMEELSGKIDVQEKEGTKSSKCDRYYISEVAFTMGWINTLDVEKLEKFVTSEDVGFEKVTDFSGMREDCSLYIGKNNEVMVVMTSGLTDFGNFVIFCNTPKKLQLRILKEIARQHFEDFLDDIERLKDYWKEKDKESGMLKIINPTVYSVSKKIPEKNVDKLKKLITDYLEGNVKISSIRGLKRYIERVNKLYYNTKNSRSKKKA